MQVGCSSNNNPEKNVAITETSTKSGVSPSAENSIELIINDKTFNLNQPLDGNSLKELNADELAILRNSYYAKHGYIFTKKNYGDFFAQFFWYKPASKNVDSELNQIDKDNINIVLAEEQNYKKADLYPVLKNFEGKWGYINSKGELVIDYIYDRAGFFNGGIASVSINGKDGLIGLDGKYVVKPVYEFCDNYNDGWAQVTYKDGDQYKHGYINKNGEVFYKDYINNSSGNFYEGLAVLEQNQQYGYINTKGDIVIEPKYTMAYDFSEGLAMVVDDNDKCGFIDKTGKLVIPFKIENHPHANYSYEDYGFSEGLAFVYVNKKFGYINSSGDYVIEAKYEQVSKFSEGLAAVRENELWGYIDTSGKTIIKPQFVYCTPFHNGYAFAKPANVKSTNENDGYQLIDKTGMSIMPTNLVYDYGGGYTFTGFWASGFYNDLARVVIMDNNKMRFVYVTKSGKVVWEMK